MKKKLSIAIFHLGFFFSGGGEKLVIKEALGLQKRGHKVDVFAPVIDRKKCFPDLIRKIRLYNLFIPFPFYFPLRDFIAITASIFLTPLRFLRFRKYDVFFGANQPGPLICYLLSKILRKPYVIYLAQPTRLVYPRKIDLEAGFGKGSFNVFFYLSHIFRPLVKFLDRTSIQGADKVLVNGSYMAAIIRKVYRVETVVCPAGCSPRKKWPSFKNRLQGQLKIGKQVINKPFVLISNRHYPQKRLDFAIKTISKTKNKKPKTILVITGRATNYTRYLKILVKQLGLERQVFFLGLVSEKDLTRLYSQAIVYLYPSPEEDFGMGVIEAMAAGTPVVAWNHAGPTVTVKDKTTGFLAKPYQLKDIQNKVLKLLKDRKLAAQFGQAGWERSREFSYRKHNRLLEAEFLKLL